MRRRLFNWACVLSLLLGAVTVVPWVSGQNTQISWVNESGTVDAWVEYSHGDVMACFDRYFDPRLDAGLGSDDLDVNGSPWNVEPTFRLGPISFARDRILPGHSRAIAVVPCWAIVAIAAVLPSIGALRFWMSRRTRVRRTLGLCVSCRYDLTGNTSGVCPECGTAVAKA
jgi:hypothetical protein